MSLNMGMKSRDKYFSFKKRFDFYYLFIFFLVFKTRYWKKWTSHCVNDPKDPITARKKSTASCCHIAGLMNLMREQGSAC